MRELGQREQRYEQDLQTASVPRHTEQPLALVPDAAIPQQLFHISDQPERCEESQRTTYSKAIGPGSLCGAVPMRMCSSIISWRWSGVREYHSRVFTKG